MQSEQQAETEAISHQPAAASVKSHCLCFLFNCIPNFPLNRISLLFINLILWLMFADARTDTIKEA